jgi:hypothetical protein
MAARLSVTQQSARKERQMTTRQWLLASAVVLPLLAVRPADATAGAAANSRIPVGPGVLVR